MLPETLLNNVYTQITLFPQNKTVPTKSSTRLNNVPPTNNCCPNQYNPFINIQVTHF